MSMTEGKYTAEFLLSEAPGSLSVTSGAGSTYSSRTFSAAKMT